jgi:hypothetical protein
VLPYPIQNAVHLKVFHGDCGVRDERRVDEFRKSRDKFVHDVLVYIFE